jgi:hyperosmotically inducible protein
VSEGGAANPGRRCPQKERFMVATFRSAVFLIASLACSAVFGQNASQDRIGREVRHELVMLPYYGVFDNLAYRVDGNTVTLFGEVTQPVKKTDAEKSVKGIEGVTRVVNNIEVLPLSTMDDQIRLAVYRAIYGFPSLERYALQAVPSIHIIVKNGHVTLVGAVANEGDKNAAGIRANSVPGVFSVDNQLKTDAQLKG